MQIKNIKRAPKRNLVPSTLRIPDHWLELLNKLSACNGFDVPEELRELYKQYLLLKGFTEEQVEGTTRVS